MWLGAQKNLILTWRSTNEIIDLVPRCSKCPLGGARYKVFFLNSIGVAWWTLSWWWRLLDETQLRWRYLSIWTVHVIGICQSPQTWGFLVVGRKSGKVTSWFEFEMGSSTWQFLNGFFLIKKIYVFILYIYIIFILRI